MRRNSYELLRSTENNLIAPRRYAWSLQLACSGRLKIDNVLPLTALYPGGLRCDGCCLSCNFCCCVACCCCNCCVCCWWRCSTCCLFPSLAFCWSSRWCSCSCLCCSCCRCWFCC